MFRRTLAELCDTDVKYDLECDLVTLPCLVLALGGDVGWNKEKECFLVQWQWCVAGT